MYPLKISTSFACAIVELKEFIVKLMLDGFTFAIF